MTPPHSGYVDAPPSPRPLLGLWPARFRSRRPPPRPKRMPKRKSAAARRKLQRGAGDALDCADALRARSSRSRPARCRTRAARRRSARSAKAPASSSATNGLILTIGYLIVEADDVKIVDSRGRTLPARIVGYDHATGLGLVRSDRAARCARRCRFGDSAKLAERDPVMIVNHGGRRRRHARLRRVAAAVHRQLGIHARSGDLHHAAHAQLERRGADRPRRAGSSASAR